MAIETSTGQVPGKQWACFVTSVVILERQKQYIDEVDDAGVACIAMHRLALDYRCVWMCWGAGDDVKPVGSQLSTVNPVLVRNVSWQWVCFVTSVVMLERQKQYIDEVDDAGVACIAMHRLALDCR